MQQRRSGSAVPRQQVFSLADGNYVVQWTETSVQDLLTGDYYPFANNDFGHPLYDYELTQLKVAGVIEDFDRAYVWLYALPERDRFTLRVQTEASRVRAYYINTTLPAEAQIELHARFEALGLLDQFCVCEHEGLLGIFNRDGTPFVDVKTAEWVQRKLETYLPDVFAVAAVAYTETDSALPAANADDPSLDLDALIAAERAVINTRAVIVVRDDDERHTIMRVLTRMRAATSAAATGAEALALLEDDAADLLILDVQLADMHGWTLLGKIREIGVRRAAHIIAIADASESDADEQALALLVAKVDGYVLRPLDETALRHAILTAL